MSSLAVEVHGSITYLRSTGRVLDELAVDHLMVLLTVLRSLRKIANHIRILKHAATGLTKRIMRAVESTNNLARINFYCVRDVAVGWVVNHLPSSCNHSLRVHACKLVSGGLIRVVDRLLGLRNAFFTCENGHFMC